jgi:hypothetical protein
VSEATRVLPDGMDQGWVGTKDSRGHRLTKDDFNIDSFDPGITNIMDHSPALRLKSQIHFSRRNI